MPGRGARGAGELSTAADAPSAGAGALSTAADAPSAGAGELSTAADAPSAGAGALSTAADAPSAGAGALSTAADAPSAGAEELSTAADAPSAGAGELSTGWGAAAKTVLTGGGLLLVAAVMLTGGLAWALAVPPLRERVTDLAGLLDPRSRQELDSKLAEYERGTGHQFAVLIVPSLEGEALEDYTMRVVEAWKLGKARADDGLLLFIAVADHKVRIEVGYGLEGVIPDVVASRVIREVITPAFRAGEYARGIDQALDLLMRAGAGEQVNLPASEPAPRSSFAVFGFIFVVFLLLSLLSRRRGPGSSAAAFLLGNMLGGGWSSRGRRGGGGFGGFSGGGGRFGGGGASGGW